MVSGGVNRRQSRRFNFKTDILLEKETSSLTPVKGITRDLSLGGACCLIAVPIKVFTIVNLKICIENEDAPLDISGRVTWIREVEDKDNELELPEGKEEEKHQAYIIGIQFLTLYSKKKERLKRLLESL